MLQGVSVSGGIGRVFDYDQTGGVYRMLLLMLLKNKHNFRVSLRSERVGTYAESIENYCIVKTP